VFDEDGSFGRQVHYRSAGESGFLVGVSADCGRMLTARTVQAPPAGSWGMAEDRFSWTDPDARSSNPVMTVSALEVWTRQLYGSAAVRCAVGNLENVRIRSGCNRCRIRQSSGSLAI
jgi:hypothetical protein